MAETELQSEPEVKLELLEENGDEKPLIGKEEDEQLPLSCLICCKTGGRKIGDLDKLPCLQGCQGNGFINQQLWSVFILQKLVQYPKNKTTDLLEDTGDLLSLSDWFVLCDKCGEIVKEAMKIFQKILKLETKFKSLQEKVRLRIRKSLQGQWNKEDISVSVTVDPAVVTAKVREHFIVTGNPNNGTEESNEDSEADNHDEHIKPPECQLDNSDDLDKTDPLYIPSDVTNVAQVTKIKSSINRRGETNSYSYSELKKMQRLTEKSRLAAEARKGVQIICKICKSQQIYTNVASYQRHLNNHWSSTKLSCPKCKFPCSNEKALKCHIARNCKRVPNQKPNNTAIAKRIEKATETETTSTTLNEDRRNSSIIGNLGDGGHLSDNDEDWPLINETEDDDNDKDYVPDNDIQIPVKAKPKSSCEKLINKKRPTNSSIPKEYSCKICLTTCLFATSWSFARHKQQHKLSKFPCPKCRYPCKTDWVLKAHLRHNQCNNRTCYKCDFCDYKTDTNLKFIQHKSVHRLERRSTKDKLGNKDVNFSDKSNYKGWRLRCEICLCQRIYTNVGSYLRHLQHHKYRSHVCPKCNYPCRTEETLKNHQKMKLCSLKKKYKCDFCDWKSTESKAALYRHRLEAHQENGKRKERKNKDFRCSYCSFKTTGKRCLDAHVKRHELYDGEKIDGKVKCKLCDTLCTGPLVLKRHVREAHFEQLGLPLFKCSLCAKNFGQKNNLKLHMDEAHTKQYRFYCDICGYGCMRRNELARHIAHRHSEERKLVCELCAATFKSDNSLRTHTKRVHGPQRKCNVELVCKYCCGKFLNKSLLDRHLKDKHKDLYVHKCDECENSYLSVASLQLHKKINHSGEQAECQFCGSKVLNRVYLYSHYKNCQKKPPDFKYKYPRN